jgi:hypothetical protein
MFFANWFCAPKRIGFDDVLYALRHPDQYIIINTLPASEQECLIQNTLRIEAEESVVNSLLTKYESVVRKIVVYGKNNADLSVEEKHKQLVGLGIGDVYIYSGGLFEWMLLQDIYGDSEFPTTKKVLDILRFKQPTTPGFA